MVTARKGSEKVSRNLLWFCKATFMMELLADELEPDDSHWEPVDVGQVHQAARGDGSAARQNLSSSQGLTHPVTQEELIPTRSQRYHLRLNLLHSQRLRDFVC
ncbi:hypothetical protein NDU88_010217 [Pleurodeles waltl]|uniref:Uncharacterized protein n=1 Tax=Pleurodeles waltl TaxID=8319 RepID=A0AAV7QZT3_PLEWA|nr:hypothetical protein NDU88_010217 [Pleurodeles waltl]